MRWPITLETVIPVSFSDSPDGRRASCSAASHYLKYQPHKGFDRIGFSPRVVASFLSVLRFLTLTAFTAFPCVRGIRAARLAIATTLALACATAVVAQEGLPVPLVERARGAEQIILGRVASVSPEWRVNDFGDRLIVVHRPRGGR